MKKKTFWFVCLFVCKVMFDRIENNLFCKQILSLQHFRINKWQRFGYSRLFSETFFMIKILIFIITKELIVAMRICLAVPVPVESVSVIGFDRHRRSVTFNLSRLKNESQSLIPLWVMQRHRKLGKHSLSSNSGSNWKSKRTFLNMEAN